MGLFGNKKIYVASTVYNMAGDIPDRINFLKTTVNSSIISNTQFSMSECLGANYLNGPGIRARSFYRWSVNNFESVGQSMGSLGGVWEWDMDAIEGQIPRDVGQSVAITGVRYGSTDYSYWAEQWILINALSKIQQAWVASYDKITNTITITWPDTSTDSFTPVDLTPTHNYFYVTYVLYAGSSVIGSRIWIYKMGSGNSIMESPVQLEDASSFFPFIPLRIDRKFLSNSYEPEAYVLSKKAYKRATNGAKYDDLISKIADNEDIDDIDHAYVMFGVNLNTQDKSSKRYLFKLFDFLRTYNPGAPALYDSWRSLIMSDYTTYRNIVIDQRVSNWSKETPEESEDMLYGSPGSVPVLPGKPVTSLQVSATDEIIDDPLNIRLEWYSITKTTGTGLKNPTAKVGDLWFTVGDDLTNASETIWRPTNQVSYANFSDSYIELTWQKTNNYWETLIIKGLVHENFIYGDNPVRIGAKEALTDEDESGFIVPLHYETVRSMSLVDSTQMFTQSTWIVFNSYEVVKQKWYQTGIFKIVVFVAMIVITVATAGATAPGLLGAAGAVGATLGFVGITATIVGAIANAIAAMILMQLISVVSTAVFGAKIGVIIATVASIAAMSFGTSMMSGMSMAQAWGNLMSVVNILQLTNAVGNGISGYVQASVAGIQGQTADMMTEYEKASKKIQSMWIEEFGQGDFHFDPTQLTNNNPGGITELPESFLSRTLMTGSDIAEMTNGMLSDFASLTLDMNAIRS